MGKFFVEECLKMGVFVNEVRECIVNVIVVKNEKFEEEEMKQKFVGQIIDVMLSGNFVVVGGCYLFIVVIEEIEDLFIGMGYIVEEGFEVEMDYYNFELFNLLKEYFVCDMQDSFYIIEEILMRM